MTLRENYETALYNKIITTKGSEQAALVREWRKLINRDQAKRK